MRRFTTALILALLAGVALASSAQAHEERASTWPTYPGSVPQFRSSGRSEVVCKPDSRVRILHKTHGATRRLNLRLLKRCRFRDIQRAVNVARNGTRILILPGVYKELPSRRKPLDDPRCASMTTQTADATAVPSYDYQLRCPNARNLIAIVGDTNGDRRCDRHCNLQITGTARPRNVVIEGDGKKPNVIRADHADGIYLGNFTAEYSDFNNIYVLETNGFHFNHIVTRWSREYGILSFTSEAGLYEHVDAYGAGDSGVYPGSGSQGRPSEQGCQTPDQRRTHTYGFEIRNVDSHDNNLGYSGTSGDSVYSHDNRFHHNATGIATDSFAAGHPGAPEHCSEWRHNYIYSNNFQIFSPQHRAYCRKPKSERSLKVVCSSFQVPLGTGALIAGGNGNIVRDNYIYDNWRSGWRLFYVPATFRGENDPAKQTDTSNDNTFTNNRMGFSPTGRVLPNGSGSGRGDFWWDGEGHGNCWTANQAAPGRSITSEPASLPTDCGGVLFSPGDPMRISSQATCAEWDPSQDPPARLRLGRPSAATPLRLAPRVVAAFGATALALGPVGCGGQGDRRPALSWTRPPLLFVAPGLPGDRILTGQARNLSGRRLELTRADFIARSADGRRVPAHVVLLSGFTHRLPPYNRDDPTSRSIEERTGARAVLAPGAATPVTVSWHQPPGAPAPVRVEVRGAALAVPADARRP